MFRLLIEDELTISQSIRRIEDYVYELFYHLENYIADIWSIDDVQELYSNSANKK